MVKFILRKYVIEHYINDNLGDGSIWCGRCGKVTPHRIGPSAPGVIQLQCQSCKSWWVYNLMESPCDLLEVESDYIYHYPREELVSNIVKLIVDQLLNELDDEAVQDSIGKILDKLDEMVKEFYLNESQWMS